MSAIPEGNWRDPATSWSLTMHAARADAARHMRAEPADPEVEARHLPQRLVIALVTAHNTGCHGWIVAAVHTPELRSMGMVGCGCGRKGQGITAFGWAVRKALLADAQ